MTPIADMVEQMLAENASAILVVAAIRAMETITRYVTPSSRVTSRGLARVRQQNWRNRQKELRLKGEVQANDGTDRNAIVTRDAVTRPVLTSFLTTSGEPLKESKKEVVARARGIRLAAGAELTQEFIDAALAAGAPRDAIPKMWAEFVDYWSDIPGQRGCKLSWLGTWRNNVKRVLSNGQWNGQKHGRRTVHDAARDLTARVQALNEPAPGLCDATGGSPVRLISQG